MQNGCQIDEIHFKMHAKYDGGVIFEIFKYWVALKKCLGNRSFLKLILK